MSELLDLALRAHGGLDRWRKFSKVGATIVSGGGLLPMKGSELRDLPQERPQSPPPVSKAPSSVPLASPIGGWCSDLTKSWSKRRLEVLYKTSKSPGSVRWPHIDDTPGTCFIAHTSAAMPVDVPQHSISAGHAGRRSGRNCAWQEGTELWRGLRARFPDGFAGHSREQDFYFGDDFLRFFRDAAWAVSETLGTSR